MSESRPNEDLADLYENAPCGYVSVFPNGRIAKINGTLSGWLGRPAEGLVGQPVHALLSFGGRIAYETHLAPLLRLQGNVDEIALDLLHADESKVPVIANAAEKRGPGGEHIFTRLTLFRAIDRRAYERGLLEARDRAQALAQDEHETAALREQFIAVLGHDLRNPISALAAGVRMLNEHESLSARGQLIATEMDAAIGRASALIEDVLDFARGRLGGGLALDRDRKAPLGPVLEQVAAEIRAIAPNRQILTRFSLEKPVDCDRARIAQLTSNLLGNAVTYGALDLPIIVEATTKDGTFNLSVANGGAPIPSAAREHLFQPFFRGAVRKSQQGLGLGLFIVSEIAKAHGGSMVVTSTDDQTRFTFSMPMAPP